MATFIVAVLTVVTIIFFIYKFSVRNFNYWKKRNVPYLQPVPVIGNFWKILSLQTPFFEYLGVLYTQFNTPYFGIYMMNKPILVLRDPDLIKNILAKDFSHFYNRTVSPDEKIDPLASKMLFIIHHPEWKDLRLQMYAFFTKRSIRNMTLLMKKVVEDMERYVDSKAKHPIELKELCAKYTTDVIACCALGIDANSFQNDDAELRVLGRDLFEFNLPNALRQSIHFIVPETARFFRIPFFPPRIMNSLKKIFWDAIDSRRSSNVKRHDIIDIILEIIESCEDSSKLQKDAIAAHALVVYLAGYETSSTVMSFCLYELAVNPEIQAKLRKEIRSAISQDGELQYEAIQDLAYLQAVILESIRKYPPVPFLDRVCNNEYKVPGSDLVIEKGISVFVPLFGLNYDPTYFSDPKKFKPERFLSDEKHTLSDCIFLPFGLGPRDCIGKRFGLASTKLGIARIVLDYELEMCHETPTHIEMEPKCIYPASAASLIIKLKKIS